MDACYRIIDSSQILTPALLVFHEVLEGNLDRMVAIAKRAGRLRPHCKTHKTREIVQRQLDRGITKHKCSTWAEAEMLANVGVRDICLAYQLVGPNIARAVAFLKKFHAIQGFSPLTLLVTVDHPRCVAALGAAMRDAGLQIGVLLDLDVGQHRTGVPAAAEAVSLYRQIANTAGLQAAGLHVYDGHQHQSLLSDRRAAVLTEFAKVQTLRAELLAEGLSVPRIVAGGSPTFPIYAEIDDPALELSPGTCALHDCGYGTRMPDLPFIPAALLLTRVISRPTADRLTVDLGYKAVASDPPAGQRVYFPDLPDAVQVLHNEEHLVLQTPHAPEFQPGDTLLAIPRHVCPTVALHRELVVIEQGEVGAYWQVAARDRRLTI